MTRREIHNELDRENRNNHNENYIELYEGLESLKVFFREGSITEKFLSDGAATFDKRTRLGDTAILAIGSSGDLPQLSTEDLTLSVNSPLFLFVGRERYTIESDTMIDFSKIDHPHLVAFFDTKTEEIEVFPGNRLNNVNENMILLASLSTSRGRFVDIQISVPVLVDGERYPVDKKQDFLSVASLTVGLGGDYPNYSTANKRLTVNSNLYFNHNNKRYTIETGTVIDFSNVAENNGVAYYDTSTDEIKVLRGNDISSVHNEMVVLAVLSLQWGDDIGERRFLSIEMGCPVRVNGFIYPYPKEVEKVTIGTGGVYPNYDTINQTLTVNNNLFLYVGDRRIRLRAGTVFDLSDVDTTQSSIYYDTSDDEFKVVPTEYTGSGDVRNLPNVYNTMILFAIISRRTNGDLVNINIGCPITIDGVLFDGDVNNLDKIRDNKNNLVYYETLTGVYKTPDVEGIEEGSENDFYKKTTEDVYDMFEDLMSRAKDRMSKEIIGYATDAIGNENKDRPILAYSLNPPRASMEEVETNYPIIIIQAGAHGYEHAGIWSSYLFTKQIIEERKNDEVMRYLWDNINFRIIPVINPWGFDHNQRANEHGVDVNNNFPTDFTYGRDPNHHYYGGREPLTEHETIALNEYYKSFNKNNVIAMIDLHNFSSIADNKIGWYASPSRKARTLLRSVAEHNHRIWLEKYPEIFEAGYDSESSSLITERSDGTARNHIYRKYGIPGITSDPLRRFQKMNGYKNNDKYVVFVSLSSLGAIVVGLVKNLK